MKPHFTAEFLKIFKKGLPASFLIRNFAKSIHRFIKKLRLKTAEEANHLLPDFPKKIFHPEAVSQRKRIRTSSDTTPPTIPLRCMWHLIHDLFNIFLFRVFHTQLQTDRARFLFFSFYIFSPRFQQK